MTSEETELTFPIRSNKLSQNVLVTRSLCHLETKFQTIDILETEVFGRVLLLDGHIQLTEFDERAYHEGLVQIPLLSLPGATRALVIGGGDGGVIRELCRSKTITHVDMVEIDEGVVKASLEHLPSLSAGAFDDPRVHLHLEDAFAWVKKQSEPYDLIVVDSTDTYEDEEGEISEMLFTENFYQDLSRLLKPEGIVVTQADNLVFCPYSLEDISALFRKVFPHVASYQALVPSFGGYSGYCYASKGKVLNPAVDAAEFGARDLAYLNPTTYALAFTKLRFA